MATSKTAWVGVGVVSYVLWISLFFAFVIPVALRRQDADEFHPIFVACLMSVFFGSPVLSLFYLTAIAAARSRGEPIPRFAIWSRNLSYALTSIVVVYVLLAFGLAFAYLRNT